MPRRLATLRILALVLGLLATACSSSHEPTSEQSQTVIDFMRPEYERGYIGGPGGDMGDARILQRANLLCNEFDEQGMVKWYMTELAFNHEPLGWAGEQMALGLIMADSGYCPAAATSWDNYQDWLVNG